jgi:group I intron endonuclease
MKSGIYSITSKNNRRYIGSAKDFDSRWDTHLHYLRKGTHWNIRLQRAYSKYGEHFFTFDVLECFPYTKSLRGREQYWIDFYCSKKTGYNIADATFGDVLSNHPERERIIRQIKETLRKRIGSMSEKEKSEKYGRFGVDNGQFGKKLSKEAIGRIRSANVGKTSFLGCKHKDSSRKKISDSAKNRTGVKNSFYGKQHTEETKNRIRDKNKGRLPANTISIVAAGVHYPSMGVAMEVLNLHYYALKKKLDSDCYPDYHRCL